MTPLSPAKILAVCYTVIQRCNVAESTTLPSLSKRTPSTSEEHDMIQTYRNLRACHIVIVKSNVFQSSNHKTIRRHKRPHFAGTSDPLSELCCCLLSPLATIDQQKPCHQTINDGMKGMVRN